MTSSKTKAIGLLAFILIAAALTGCGAQEKHSQGSGNSIIEPTSEPSVSPEPSIEPTPALQMEASIYEVDDQWIELVERKVQLTYETENDLVIAALAALQQDEGEGANTISLWKKVEILSIDLQDGQVKLDIHIPDDARLGAFGEMQMVESLQKTLFQFDFVQEIQLLVDGEQVESMMGHVELEHPMLRETN